MNAAASFNPSFPTMIDFTCSVKRNIRKLIQKDWSGKIARAANEPPSLQIRVTAANLLQDQTRAPI
jgi:hypothetical protein